MVGLLPLGATSVIEPWQRERVPRVDKVLRERFKHMPELRESIHATGPGHFGYNERGIAALVNENRLRRILTRMLDENEFLSPYGIRALSRYHAEHPFIVDVQGQQYRVNYLPAESDTGMFGGNFQLAWSDMDASECGADPRLVIVPSPFSGFVTGQKIDVPIHVTGQTDDFANGEPTRDKQVAWIGYSDKWLPAADW